ncbi:MAG: ABC transporter substrate-binding protein [Gemmataceae bacterium]
MGCSRSQPDPHVLGHVIPLSGPHRDRGQQALQGVQLAVEEANAGDLILGRKIAVLHADSAGEPKTAAGQAVRLATVNHAEALLSGINKAEAVEVATAARDNALIAFNSAGFVGPAPKVVFSLGLSESQRARAIDWFLSEKLKPTKIAIVSPADDLSANRFADELSRRAKDRKLVPTLLHVSTDDDIKSAAQKLAESGGAVVAVLPVDQFLKLREQMVKSGSLPEIIFAGDESERADLVARADSTYFVSDYATTSLPADNAFAKKYRDKFHTEPTAEAASAYDMTRLIVAGAREAKGFAPKTLHDKLIELKDFDGVMGKLTISPEQTCQGPTFVIQIQAGKEDVRERLEPEAAQKKSS